MEIGRILGGRYKIEGRIGSGGMSTVYKAHEIELEREVAVKVLISSLADDPQLVERFNREARTIASLQHNSIIPIYYYGIEGDFGTYLVMPLLKGGTLEQRLNQLTMLPSLTEVGELAERLGDALQYAHNKDVVHRDIKFSNIMFDDAGSPYLMDFGIAKLLNTTNLTGTGMTVGTPNFMPPEQWRNDDITAAVDQYAFSVLLFAMLTRRMPFEADTAPALMYQHLQEDPPPVSDFREDIPQAIEDALSKALSKDPADRFDSISDFTSVISQAALASTRKYSGFFKAAIENKAKPVQTPTGVRQQSIMPNTPTEMVAQQKLDGAETTISRDGVSSSERLAAGQEASGGVNRTAFYAGMISVVIIGALIIGGLFINNQRVVANQQTETAIVVAEVTETVIAVQTVAAIAEATETVIFVEAAAVNATQTTEAEPTVTDTSTATPEPSDTASNTNTPSPEPSDTPTNTATNTLTPTNTSTATPDVTGTQLMLSLTEAAIEQATNNAALRLTGTAISAFQTQRAEDDAVSTISAENANATTAANAAIANTATVESALIRTEQANINATSTGIAVRSNEQAANAAATAQALNRNGTATAFAVIQANFDATATQITVLATQAAENRLDYGVAFSDFGTGQDEIQWTFTAEDGDRISISARSSEFDTVLEVYLGNQFIIADDNGGYRNDSRISNLRIEEDGNYTVILSAAGNDDLIGEYVVGITEMLNCPSSISARLLVGEFARVTFGGLTNNLRVNPAPDSSRLDRIPEGGVFEVIGGPVCNDDFTWYQVEYGNNIGWTAEGDDEEYWLELLPEDDEPVLLAGGRGLSDGTELDAGTFQVEYYCSRRGLNTSNNGVDWFCVNVDNVPVITLVEEDFDQICQDTYGIDESFARQDGEATEPAFQWLCYYYPGYQAR